MQLAESWYFCNQHNLEDCDLYELLDLNVFVNHLKRLKLLPISYL